MKAKKPLRGRPPRADKAATERLEIRLTKLERAAWEHEAVKRGMSISEYIRQCAVLGERYLLAGESVDERKIPFNDPEIADIDRKIRK